MHVSIVRHKYICDTSDDTYECDTSDLYCMLPEIVRGSEKDLSKISGLVELTCVTQLSCVSRDCYDN